VTYKNTKQVFSSTFYAAVTLKGTLPDVEGTLRNNPALKQVSKGTSLKYELCGEGKKGIPGDLIEFRKDAVVMTYFFNKPALEKNISSLLKFLAVLAYLKDLFAVDAGSIYQYIIDSLRNSVPILAPTAALQSRVENNRIEALSKINISLSHEVRRQSSMNLALYEDIKRYRAFSKEVMEKLTSDSQYSSDPYLVFRKYGMDEKLVHDVKHLVTKEEGMKQGLV
jgi:hypothetical protein